jgi:hypothetical protein
MRIGAAENLECFPSDNNHSAGLAPLCGEESLSSEVGGFEGRDYLLHNVDHR